MLMVFWVGKGPWGGAASEGQLLRVPALIWSRPAEELLVVLPGNDGSCSPGLSVLQAGDQVKVSLHWTRLPLSNTPCSASPKGCWAGGTENSSLGLRVTTCCSPCNLAHTHTHPSSQVSQVQSCPSSLLLAPPPPQELSVLLPHVSLELLFVGDTLPPELDGQQFLLQRDVSPPPLCLDLGVSFFLPPHTHHQGEGPSPGPWVLRPHHFFFRLIWSGLMDLPLAGCLQAASSSVRMILLPPAPLQEEHGVSVRPGLAPRSKGGRRELQLGFRARPYHLLQAPKPDLVIGEKKIRRGARGMGRSSGSASNAGILMPLLLLRVQLWFRPQRDLAQCSATTAGKVLPSCPPSPCMQGKKTARPSTLQEGGSTRSQQWLSSTRHPWECWLALPQPGPPPPARG